MSDKEIIRLAQLIDPGPWILQPRCDGFNVRSKTTGALIAKNCTKSVAEFIIAARERFSGREEIRSGVVRPEHPG